MFRIKCWHTKNNCKIWQEKYLTLKDSQNFEFQTGRIKDQKSPTKPYKKRNISNNVLM